MTLTVGDLRDHLGRLLAKKAREKERGERFWIEV
jgi:hypothetical protein